MVLGHPVDARDDLLGGAGALVVEHAYADDVRLLRDTVRGTGEGARDVRAVAVPVVRLLVAVDRVEAVGGAALEVVVADPAGLLNSCTR